MKNFKLHFFFIFLFSTITQTVYADRLKDMVSFAGIRSNQLMGYGIVVGLDGTGDSSLALTLQSMQSTISQFGMNVDAGSLSGKNSAAVMITADLDPFTKVGQKIGVTVSSMGKAKSLRGGTLLMTPLKGADGKTYAIAQGNLAVGGFGVEGADGSSLSVNIPTVGSIANGATVERMVEAPFINSDNFVMNLHQGDFTTANRITEEINKVFGPDVAKALDHTSISVRAPKDPSQKVSFMSLLENIEVDPASPIAKVVVNARTGTIVIGGDVRVTPAAVSHGSLTVKVNEDTNTTPGQTLFDDAGNVTQATAANTENDTEINAGAETASAFVFDAGTSLADVVDAINAIGTTSSDLVAILEALRAAGALRAQMIII
ncbi:MAG: flagellar biosynthesis protein FlgI [Alphaproteobacteria bacterium TMED199]|jgi:flagellar P-ring protein precursor FlgI|nr:MAG: flagellar biosynthesis protein FlgI [Alphaproteobacteria bacterium TMED199]|tara:strand:+ start:1453 stop:2577 length:1125 start_codon:yes stop_codon:yes gene_type:complete